MSAQPQRRENRADRDAMYRMFCSVVSLAVGRAWQRGLEQELLETLDDFWHKHDGRTPRRQKAPMPWRHPGSAPPSM